MAKQITCPRCKQKVYGRMLFKGKQYCERCWRQLQDEEAALTADIPERM